MVNGRTQRFPFALIPAAGRSRRMGSPKLLLDLAGQTLIARVLAALGRAGLTNRLVVVNSEDDVLKREVERHGGRALVPPTAPPEMRDSVAFGLHAVADDLAASGEAGEPDWPWLLIPADHPVVLAETVQALLEAAGRNPGRIIVPTHRGRRGHPTVFAWKHALEIDQIPAGQGFNWILKQAATDVVEVAVASEGVLIDLDTPDDYDRLRAIWESS
jgi:molybdenum cofactor cytidylyltransferase